METAMWHASRSMANFPVERFKKPYTHGGRKESPSRSRILTASWTMSTGTQSGSRPLGRRRRAKTEGNSHRQTRCFHNMEKRYEASGMEASKTMAEADVALWSKGLTRENRWQSVKLQLFLWKQVRPWQLKLLVSIANAWLFTPSINESIESWTTDWFCMLILTYPKRLSHDVRARLWTTFGTSSQKFFAHAGHGVITAWLTTLWRRDHQSCTSCGGTTSLAKAAASVIFRRMHRHHSQYRKPVSPLWWQ